MKIKQTTPQTAPFPATSALVFFARESVWNLAFNRRPSLLLPLRVFGLLAWEAILGCSRDSVILDSPLSETGRQQSAELLRYLENLQLDVGPGPRDIERLSTDDDEARHRNNNEAKTPTSIARRRLLEAAPLSSRSPLRDLHNSETLVVSSGLRRALSTGSIALHFRWAHLGGGPYVLGCLGETTRNADGYSLTMRDFGALQLVRPVPISERRK